MKLKWHVIEFWGPIPSITAEDQPSQHFLRTILGGVCTVQSTFYITSPLLDELSSKIWSLKVNPSCTNPSTWTGSAQTVIDFVLGPQFQSIYKRSQPNQAFILYIQTDIYTHDSTETYPFPLLKTKKLQDCVAKTWIYCCKTEWCKGNICTARQIFFQPCYFLRPFQACFFRRLHHHLQQQQQ